jgi:hypothetical protein
MDYGFYESFLNKITTAGNLDFFKSDPNYTGVLEHVSLEQGLSYLKFIYKSNITKASILDFCRLNDRVGSPIKSTFDFGDASPTSLRYICQAHIILTHLQNLKHDPIDIVEVGGGYGGLCLALHYFAPFYNLSLKSYTICDLKEAGKLQALYLSQVNPSLKVDFVDAMTFGKDIQKTNVFLVSNYCFAEIRYDLQQQYIQHLFPKVKHGFMIWNHAHYYDFGFPVIKKDEEYNYLESNDQVFGPNNNVVFF